MEEYDILVERMRAIERQIALIDAELEHPWNIHIEYRHVEITEEQYNNLLDIINGN